MIIDFADGRPTGYALVLLGSESEAERAKAELNKKSLGNRYIDINTPDLKH